MSYSVSDSRNYYVLAYLAILTLMQMSPCYSFEEDHGTLPHLQQTPVLLTLQINYHPVCSSEQNVTIGIINIPVADLILNVLERSADQYRSTFNTFELVYLQNSGYFVLSIKDITTTSECQWTMTTDPAISDIPISVGPAGKSVNDVFVSNYGMEITFTYESVGSTDHYVPIYDYLSGKVTPIKHSTNGTNFISNPLTTSYGLSFPTGTCPIPSDLFTDPMSILITSGQTALNVLESGADADPNRTFTLTNWFGLFYSVRSINTAIHSSSCQWCVKYSPTADESVPSYLLQVALNDFVIPVDGGLLTLEYTTQCNNAQDSLGKGIITDEVLLGSRKRHQSNHKQKQTCCTAETNGYNISIYSLILGGGLVTVGVFVYAIVIVAISKKHSKLL